MRQRLRLFVLFALGAGVLSPAFAGERSPAAADAAPAVARLQQSLAAGATRAGERILSIEALRLFYAARDHRPAWLAAGRPNREREALLEALRAADLEGLDPADYHLAAIERLIARSGGPARGATAAPAGDAEDLDLLLTDAFFLYAAHLTGGRLNPATVEPEWNIAGRSRNLVLLLTAALELRHVAATLAELPPPRDDYRRLRRELRTLRSAVAAGGWPIVPPGPALREGDRGPRVAALRRRLAATADLPSGDDRGNELFDLPVADAVRRFQSRHGIEPDAIVGKRTLSELNAPASRRATQIVANLERLRWLPRALHPRHLLVNVADYRLVLTEDGRQVADMRVIVGRRARRTPFFTGEITSIRLNPTWTVPVRLAVEDKLPLLREDPGALLGQGFRVFTPAPEGWREIDPAEVDWAGVSDTFFPYLLRQDPGPENALGRIKFQIPNRHDIYLHDTPSRGLFARAERGFSSGCIRVERALDLAERLLAGDPAWPRERIVETIESGETVDVVLSEPMPVYLLAWTAWVDDDGTVQFRDDIYGSDAAILEGLARPL